MSSIQEGPRSTKKEEFEELIKLVDRCFPLDKNRGGMLARWPHCFILQEQKLKNNLIIRKNGKIVSHVAYIPQELIIENGEVKVAGITGVGTDEKYRSQGLMSTLLKCCIERIEKEKFALSDLDGDRQRYNHFGWENAGREWTFLITSKSLIRNKTKKSKMKFRKYTGERTDLDIIIKIHETEPLRMKRSRKLYQMLLSRKGIEVWLCCDAKNNYSYLIIDDKRKVCSVREFGGYDAGIKNILSYLFEKYSLEKVDIFSPYSHPLNKLFFDISAGAFIRSSRMVKIIDLLDTLKKFSSQMKRKYQRLGKAIQGEVTLEIKNTNQKASIFASQQGIKVSEEISNNRMFVSEIEGVRLLFGLTPPGEVCKLNKNTYFLDIVFPLDFYIWRNEAV